MTKIFASYSEFLQREDKKVNGVDANHAEEFQEWEKENETNDACWNCFDCSGCSGCSDCSGCSGCSDCSRSSDCSDCSGCSDCSDCFDCSGCSDCSRSSGCSDCSDCSGKQDIKDISKAPPTDQVDEIIPPALQVGFPEIPVIKNIHQTVYEHAIQPNAFDMSSWHTAHSCGTAHCWGGWAVFLAGDKGRVLEAATSTEFAAMMIYKESSPIRISPVRFYESNETALAYMKSYAEQEAATVTE